MAEFDGRQQEMSLLKNKKKNWETFTRLTAPTHVTLNSWREHERIEGYYEFKEYGHLFSCDRLLKLETIFGKVQMGYNPNRARSFIFANMKTNLYDTVNSRYQKEMKEYQQKPEKKKGNENRAWVSKRWHSASVLLEKAENKPWTEQSMEPYFKNGNMEALLKTMPFFHEQDERSQLEEIRQNTRELQEGIRENSLQGKWDENAQLNRLTRESSQESELLQAILARKNAGKRAFLRKVNYAFDIDKHNMFEYYREQRRKADREEISAVVPGDGSEEEGNVQDSAKKDDK